MTRYSPVTQYPARPALLVRVTRSLRPSYGARCNAAEGVEDLRRSRSQRAQAAAAFAATAAQLPEPRPSSRPSW